MPRIKDIVIDCFLSQRNKMNPNERPHCFEVFGFDFLMDEDFRIWLIEVNTNPYLGTPSQHLKEIIPNMVEDAIQICVDPVCAPRNSGYRDGRENDFELVYREESEEHGAEINKRGPFSVDLCYPVPELKPLIGKKSNLKQKSPTIKPR